MSKRSLWWKVPLAVVGIAIGLVLLLLTAVACVLYVPSLRTAAMEKGLAFAREQTALDIDIGRLYLSPFHQSPKVLYRAYKGEADLPVEIEADSLFVGHRGQDTLLYTHALRLKADLLTADRFMPFSDFTAIPIVVDTLQLARTTFHSDSLIEAVGIDVIADRLEVSSPELLIAEGKYPLHGLRLHDAFIGIDLRDTPPDTTAQDTTPTLMAFDVPDGDLRNVRFLLTPLNMDVRVRSFLPNVLADVGGSVYDVRRLDAGDVKFSLGSLYLPFDTLYGDVLVDLERNLITSHGLHALSGELGAKADLQATALNLETMGVDVIGDADYKGSQAHLRASYNIDTEAYNATVHIDRVNLAPFMPDSTRVVVAGDIEAVGRGIDTKRPLNSHIKVHLDEALYGPYDLSNTSINLSTDRTTSLALDMPGLNADVRSPMPLFTLIDRIQPLLQTVSDSAVLGALTSLQDLTMLDTIRQKIPALQANIALHKGSPIQAIIDSTGLDIDEVLLALRSDSELTELTLDASTPDLQHPEDSSALRLPAAEASLGVKLTEGRTNARLTAHSRPTDGALSFHDLQTDAVLRLELEREGRTLNGTGRLQLDSIAYDGMTFGSRSVDITVSPSEAYDNALRAEVATEEIPLDILDGIVTLPDIDLHGAVRASASVDGLPGKTDISAEVYPLGVKAKYKPYDINISLGETPIVMKHNHLDLNGLPIYGADSTYVSLTGGLDLDSMMVDVTLEADSFAPTKLVKGGPLPVYGELATDVRGRVTGHLDSILADVDVTVLPTTDLTYPIDEKNLAQVRPHGTINLKYGLAEGELNFGGRINVDDGEVRYSPKMYPIMPFRVDSGSHVDFHGPLGRTMLNVSASQKVKANVQSEGEQMRRVDFITGVRVNGELDSIGLDKISFFLEAPEDEEVTEELVKLDEDQREGMAAALLATGMYMGESNVAAHTGGYALTSIVNSRIDAAMANSKLGKIVDIDISSSQNERAAGTTNDFGVSLSKSFFEDRFRIMVGATLSDNPEANSAMGLYAVASAEYKLTKEGNVLLRVFTQRDYNNIIEGDLQKSGIGVRATKDWRLKQLYKTDSIQRTYTLTADADVAYRSNNSLGPNLSLTSSIKNLLGHNETFSVKGYGAYYWALQNRQKGAPKMTDTYKLGVDAALIFPYLHWVGNNNPEGDTRYKVGYLYENIAGGYGVHKVSGSLSYFIRSPFSKYITHVFTPLSLSVVMMKAESTDLLDKAATYPQLFKLLAGDEFIPAVGYEFTYNDYSARRAVNTMFDIEIKEAGNMINGIYCLFGHTWNEKQKPLGKRTFDQFVKTSIELHNKFNLTDKICIATRIFGGALLPVGNSVSEPLSESFYAGGPNNMRAAARYSYGPGNYHSTKYNQAFFHAGAVKLEGNFEFRFPIVWKLFGAAFVDAGNVWNWYNSFDRLKGTEYEGLFDQLGLSDELYDGIFNNPYLLSQIALGTGVGLRLDIDGLVIRLDLGVGLHVPYQTYKYDKDYKPDYDQPINTYYNIPFILDGLRLNFGIGYPF